MKSMRIFLLLGVGACLMADVKTEEKSQVHFEGTLGRMMGLFGGRAAREGIVDTVAVKGNRKMTASESTGRIVDLDEEKIYELDMRGKTYKVVTFDEMRRRMQEAEEKMKRGTGQPSKAEPAQREGGEKQKEVEIDFDLKESGEKKTINGYDCREVVMTITVREKGKTLEEGGGMVMTTHNWLAPRIAAMKEIAEFERRYAEKMRGPFSLGASAEQMAAAMAMYPMMKQAMSKFQAENVNMDGTAILTVMTMEAVESPEQASQAQAQAQAKPQERDSSVGIPSVRGVLGGLGRRAVRKKAESDSASGAPKTRATVFSTTHELLKVSAAVAASDVAIPAGFRQK